MKALNSLIVLLAVGMGCLGLAAQAYAQAAGAGSEQGGKVGQRQKVNGQRVGGMENVLAQLGLTADQQKQIQEVRQKYDAQRQSAGGQRPSRAALQKLRQQQDAEVAQILTPDQRTKWEQLRAQRAAGGGHRGAGAHH